ncbi:Hypothetical_protein [Hexamita inflata]|uniref:Hypothetical_protein n=1 Tax=Hexamita inflata TaxID=28002 RepID=A0AA86PCC9_9EUKA|nr:Hypothetical protein HINF_LOCUS23885 [Hexamita inflata]
MRQNMLSNFQLLENLLSNGPYSASKILIFIGVIESYHSSQHVPLHTRQKYHRSMAEYVLLLNSTLVLNLLLQMFAYTFNLSIFRYTILIIMAPRRFRQQLLRQYDKLPSSSYEFLVGFLYYDITVIPNLKHLILEAVQSTFFNLYSIQ